MSGASAVFLAWASRAGLLHEDSELRRQALVAAAGGACQLTRRAAHLAFQAKKRGMTTPAVIDHLGEAFESLWPAGEEEA